MYQVPESHASIGQNRFEFGMPDGSTYSVPKLKYLAPEFVEQLGEMTQQQVVFALLRQFHPGLIGKFQDMHQIEALYLAWAEASGVNVGESSGSGDSSSSIAEPSTETSSSSDAPSTISAPTA